MRTREEAQQYMSSMITGTSSDSSSNPYKDAHTALDKIYDEFEDTIENLLDWAVERKKLEVINRPDNNVFKRILNDTWSQVIREIQRISKHG